MDELGYITLSEVTHTQKNIAYSLSLESPISKSSEGSI